MLAVCCKGRERSLIHQTLLGLLTVDGTSEWVMILCLDGGVVRIGTMPNSQGPTPTLFIFPCFFCSHIGVQVSLIPGLEVMGAWSEAGGAIAKQGWLGPVGLVGSPGASFDSSPR